MKKIVFLFILLLAGWLYYNRLHSEKPVLRVGSECDYAPNNWEEKRPSDSNFPLVNNEGFYGEGYDLQIAKLVAEELGMKLEVKKIAWNDLLPALNRGEIDAVFSGMLDTEERKKIAAFSDTYEVKKTEYAVIINEDSKYSNIKKLEELYGAKMVAQKDTNLDAAIDQIPGVTHMKPVDTVPEMLEMVVNNEVDGMVINYDTGRSYERIYKNLKMIRFPEGEGFVLGFNGICAGVRKRDKDLLSKINKALDGISIRDRQKVMDRTIARVWENL